MTAPQKPESVPVTEVEEATIRLAGDSGDGVQLAGGQFTRTAALAGNVVCTLPDFPAEIRAPAGTLAGVSGFQVHFGSRPIHTPGDRLDALVAMNPAALKTNLPDLEKGGILIVNRDAFLPAELLKAGYDADPLDDGSLADYRVLPVPMTTLNREAVARGKNGPNLPPLSPREADRCKNFFALGLVYWLYDRSLEPTLRWIKDKFAGNPAVREANARSLRAGYHYGETSAALPARYRVAAAPIPPGRYRGVTGSEAMALGLVAAAKASGLPLLFAAHPITPAADLLHRLADLTRFGVRTFQAEDDLAAVGAALGAAFGGALGVTATSGPGVCLGAEGVGLAVMTELPLVVIDVQRGGPSTGLPTKTEQADLLQALFGRHGECPLAVVAPRSPADCFATVLEAVRLAVGFMTPVFVLSDGYLASGAEPWLVPKAAELPPIPVRRPSGPNGERDGQPVFWPYRRDDRLVRAWAVPGTPGLEHRVGGLEKEDGTGNVSYDPADHEHMVRTRAQKIAKIADAIPALDVDGPDEGELLVVGWGGTYGAIATAVQRARGRGLKVAHAHPRHLNPLPRNTGDVLRRYTKILVPELNGGQLRLLLRAAFLVEAAGLNKVQGRPFLVSEIEDAINQVVRSQESGVRNQEQGARDDEP
jgi:2-oxoglutarate ferredoxin oxidoreductase subunit alpha